MIPSLFPRRLLAALTLGGLALSAQAADFTVAYQTTVDPAKVAQADGAYEKASKSEIDWRKFDGGAEVITAVASGDVQIGYVGSSPLAAAATRQLPIQTFLIATQIGDAEALVARNGAGITKPEDLIGKKIAVPFVSTGHYSLLAALKHWQIDPTRVTILNLAPPAIIAAWQRGDIDATYVWDPALGVAKSNGKVLISSAELGKLGAPTFDAWIVRKDFAEKHPEVVRAFAKVTLDAYADYRKDPQAWLADQGKTLAALEELAGALGLPTPPLRIECYDISTIQGTNTVGSMVVFEEGRPRSGEYRRFRVRTAAVAPGRPDDYASHREVLRRRFYRALEAEEGAAEELRWRLPDLVVIDGGLGQVNAARGVLDELGLHDLPVVGLEEGDRILCRRSPALAPGAFRASRRTFHVRPP